MSQDSNEGIVLTVRDNSSHAKTQTSIQSLSVELQLMIYKFLSNRDLASLTQTDKKRAKIGKEVQLARKWYKVDMDKVQSVRVCRPIHVIRAIKRNPGIAKHVRVLRYTPLARIFPSTTETFHRLSRRRWILNDDLDRRQLAEAVSIMEPEMDRLVHARVITIAQKSMAADDITNHDGWTWLILLSMLPNVEKLIVSFNDDVLSFPVEIFVRYVHDQQKSPKNKGTTINFAAPKRLKYHYTAHLYHTFDVPVPEFRYTDILLLPSLVQVKGYFVGELRQEVEFTWPSWTNLCHPSERRQDAIDIVSNVEKIWWVKSCISPRDQAAMMVGMPKLRTIKYDMTGLDTWTYLEYNDRDLDGNLRLVRLFEASLYERYLTHSYRVKTGGRLDGLALPRDLQLVIPEWNENFVNDYRNFPSWYRYRYSIGYAFE